MRRVAAFLALLAVAGLGSGVLDYLHQLDHQRQAALWAAAIAKAAGGHHRPVVPPLHDQSHCPICATLQAPLSDTAAAPLIILLALLALAAAPRPVVIHVARLALPIICRGPPAA